MTSGIAQSGGPAPTGAPPPPPATSTPALFRQVTLCFLAAALVPTLWPALDLRAATLFADPQAPLHALHWWWLQPVNDYIPEIFRLLLALAALAWAIALFSPRWQRLRLGLAFFVIAGIVGPGAVVNFGFKDNWQRARPWQVQNFGGSQHFTRAALITDQCDANCSFVSGHVACGVFFVTLGLVHRRRQREWATAGVLGGLLIGFARMSDMAHWLSDVLWAFPITLVSSWLIWKLLLLYYNKPWRTVG